MKKINVLSLFGGIEAGMEAITRMGMQDRIANYYSAEIDPYPAKMAKHNFQNVQHIGSVTEVKGDQFDRIDFLIGGPPCQDLSIAGKRAGLDGERSGLFYEFVRILNETKPEYFFMENVASMPKDAFETINACLGFEGVKRNASKVSAQNRRRLYWLGKRNDDGTYSRVDTPEPEDRGIMLRDILEDIPLDNPFWKQLYEKYVGFIKDTIKYLAINANYSKASQEKLKKSGHEIIVSEKSEISFVGQFRRASLRVHSDQDNCPTLTANMGTGGNNVPVLISESKSETIVASYGKGAYPANVGTTRERTLVFGLAHRNRGMGKQPECNMTEKANALTSVRSDSECMDVQNFVWRKLTVRECARLQGFRDEYDTSVLSDSRAYKGFGNSWQVDEVIEFWKHLPFFN